MLDIINTLEEDGSFTTLLSLLAAAGMTERLRDAGPFTLFAPNDAAFQRVNVDEISKDREDLASLLTYHMVRGEYSRERIAENQHLLTENGKSLSVTVEQGHQVIDNAKYVTTDIRCGNGIIHVIDNVFLPQFSGWYCGGCC